VIYVLLDALNALDQTQISVQVAIKIHFFNLTLVALLARSDFLGAQQIEFAILVMNPVENAVLLFLRVVYRTIFFILIFKIYFNFYI